MSDMELIWSSAILLFAAFFWALRIKEIYATYRFVPEIDPREDVPSPLDPPLISVIVPAHNEEAAIVECLKSVLEQDYSCFELILVDDRSRDRTLAIAQALAERQANFKVISLRELPSGWTGKCHALDVGVKHAKGEWLAFLDADSRIHPCTLTHCYHQAVSRGVNMVTLSPGLVLTTFWDKALQPVLAGMSCILFPLARINDPHSRVASANGMFFFIRRTAYNKIGGHHDVKDLAVEDIGIGKRVKAAGLGLLFANGRKVLRTKMYTGARESIRGWTRILAASMNYEIPQVLKHLLTHMVISLPVMVLAMILYVPSAMKLWPQHWFVLPALVLGEVSIALFFFYPLLGVPRSCSLLMFLGNATLVGVLVLIIKKILRNDALQWRGTTYEASRYTPKRLDPLPSRFSPAQTPTAFMRR